MKATADRHAGLLADNKPFGKSSYGAAKDIDLMNESQMYVGGGAGAQSGVRKSDDDGASSSASPAKGQPKVKRQKKG